MKSYPLVGDLLTLSFDVETAHCDPTAEGLLSIGIAPVIAGKVLTHDTFYAEVQYEDVTALDPESLLICLPHMRWVQGTKHSLRRDLERARREGKLELDLAEELLELHNTYTMPPLAALVQIASWINYLKRKYRNYTSRKGVLWAASPLFFDIGFIMKFAQIHNNGSIPGLFDGWVNTLDIKSAYCGVYKIPATQAKHSLMEVRAPRRVVPVHNALADAVWQGQVLQHLIEVCSDDKKSV